jgi:3'-5' exoribonuclease
MKNLFIKDLQKSQILTQELFAIQNVERMQTKDGKPYYRVYLSDKTGTIVGQVWSDAIPNIERSALDKGNVIMLDGKVEEFKGVLQVNILKANRVEEQYLEDFVEGSKFDLDLLWSKLDEYIANIKNAQVRKFIDKVFADPEIKIRYMRYPAAEYVHHGFQGGLLEHVVEMLDISKPMQLYYPEADFDLITAGIIMHDIGKIYELERIGVTIQRTMEGYLVGHLVKSFELVHDFGKDVLDPQTLLKLKHIVLSHHGELEYGSPIKPATIEAMIVCRIDMLSSQTRSVQRVVNTKAVDELGFTEYDRIIGTKIFVGNEKEKLIAQI